MWRRPLPTVVWLLVLLGLGDLVATLVVLASGNQEGNPIFRALLDVGPWAFIAGKVLFLAGPILILEYARPRVPKSVDQAYWICLTFYLVLLGLQAGRL